MTKTPIFLNDRVVCDPEICHGKPTVKGTRVMVQGVLEFLGAGDSIEEVLEAYPGISREDVLACIASAAEVMGRPLEARQSA